MSSTQIQLDRDRVVSVQTQSITALSSVRKGTNRNLEETKTREREEGEMLIQSCDPQKYAAPNIF